MNKSLLFSDSHSIEKNGYQKLLDIGISEKVDDIFFLGDADGSKSYKELIEFKDFANDVGINFKAVRGNHDQAWFDYGTGKDKEYAIAKNIVDSGMKNEEILRFIQEMEISISEIKWIMHFICMYKIEFRHTFAKGKKLSGTIGQQKRKKDHRFRYPELWYSSFGTDNTTGKGLESYDAQVLLENFRYMNWNAIEYILMGHGHLPKCWTYKRGGKIEGGEIIKNNLEIIYPKKGSIIQVGGYNEGHYAILYRGLLEIGIKFKRI